MRARCAFCGVFTEPTELHAADADTAIQRFVVLFCAGCGCGSLRDPPSDAELSAFYRSDYFGFGSRKFLTPVQWIFDAGKRRLARAVLGALDGCVEPRILDVGCGTGRLLSELEQLGASAIGTEREGGASRAVRAGLTVIEGNLEDLGLGSGSMDAIVVWHVLEHLRDPVAALRTATDLLRPGGVLVLAVPNPESWQARLFGPYWFHLDLPRHLHFFTRHGLSGLLEAEGLAITRSGTTQVSQGIFGFVQSVLNAAFPSRPNRLYQLLREPLAPANFLQLVAWSLATLPLLPFALLEVICAGALGYGATCKLEARKR